MSSRVAVPNIGKKTKGFEPTNSEMQEYTAAAPASRASEIGNLLVKVQDHEERLRQIQQWWHEEESGQDTGWSSKKSSRKPDIRLQSKEEIRWRSNGKSRNPKNNKNPTSSTKPPYNSKKGQGPMSSSSTKPKGPGGIDEANFNDRPERPNQRNRKPKDQEGLDDENDHGTLNIERPKKKFSKNNSKPDRDYSSRKYQKDGQKRTEKPSGKNSNQEDDVAPKITYAFITKKSEQKKDEAELQKTPEQSENDKETIATTVVEGTTDLKKNSDTPILDEASQGDVITQNAADLTAINKKDKKYNSPGKNRKPSSKKPHKPKANTVIPTTTEDANITTTDGEKNVKSGKTYVDLVEGLRTTDPNVHELETTTTTGLEEGDQTQIQTSNTLAELTQKLSIGNKDEATSITTDAIRTPRTTSNTIPGLGGLGILNNPDLLGSGDLNFGTSFKTQSNKTEITSTTNPSDIGEHFASSLEQKKLNESNFAKESSTSAVTNTTTNVTVDTQNTTSSPNQQQGTAPTTSTNASTSGPSSSPSGKVSGPPAPPGLHQQDFTSAGNNRNVNPTGTTGQGQNNMNQQQYYNSTYSNPPPTSASNNSYNNQNSTFPETMGGPDQQIFQNQYYKPFSSGGNTPLANGPSSLPYGNSNNNSQNVGGSGGKNKNYNANYNQNFGQFQKGTNQNSNQVMPEISNQGNNNISTFVPQMNTNSYGQLNTGNTTTTNTETASTSNMNSGSGIESTANNTTGSGSGNGAGTVYNSSRTSQPNQGNGNTNLYPQQQNPPLTNSPYQYPYQFYPQQGYYQQQGYTYNNYGYNGPYYRGNNSYNNKHSSGEYPHSQFIQQGNVTNTNTSHQNTGLGKQQSNSQNQNNGYGYMDFYNSNFQGQGGNSSFNNSFPGNGSFGGGGPGRNHNNSNNNDYSNYGNNTYYPNHYDPHNQTNGDPYGGNHNNSGGYGPGGAGSNTGGSNRGFPGSGGSSNFGPKY